mmetsp:Transcript_17539/g.38650  ORF Transcript_17539/g.38650 Transcript_17539/m.38650 type:complete len:311 (+) Transcript_17539:2524-3456(+)
MQPLRAWRISVWPATVRTTLVPVSAGRADCCKAIREGFCTELCFAGHVSRAGFLVCCPCLCRASACDGGSGFAAGNRTPNKPPFFALSARDGMRQRRRRTGTDQRWTELLEQSCAEDTWSSGDLQHVDMWSTGAWRLPSLSGVSVFCGGYTLRGRSGQRGQRGGDWLSALRMAVVQQLRLNWYSRWCIGGGFWLRGVARPSLRRPCCETAGSTAVCSGGCGRRSLPALPVGWSTWPAGTGVGRRSKLGACELRTELWSDVLCCIQGSGGCGRRWKLGGVSYGEVLVWKRRGQYRQSCTDFCGPNKSWSRA